MIPTAIAFGPDGSLYYTDAGARSDIVAPKVRRIAPNGVVSTVAGNGKVADAGDGLQATAASFVSVDGVAVHPLRHLVLAEPYTTLVRESAAVTRLTPT